MKTKLTDAPLIFSGPISQFTDAVILGQGLPIEKDGIPIKYAWKESLHLGTFKDTRGIEHVVQPARIDTVIADYRRAFAKGYRPPIMLGHPRHGEAKDPSKTRGQIVDVRKNSEGNLELLHQFIGKDAIQDAARNKTSICILPNITDENGEHYDQLIDHQALVPDPQLSSLSDFTPALAASRGMTAEAVVLQLASELQEPEMVDLKKLREAIGAGEKFTDEQVIELATTKVSESGRALELSRSTATEAATLKTRAETAETALAAERTALATANAKVLELSRSAPDDKLLAVVGKSYERMIDQAFKDGKCSKAQFDLVKGEIKDGAKYDSLMLSRSEVEKSPVDLVLKVLELNKGLHGTVSGGQALPDPNNPNPEPVSDARKKQLLQHAGM